MEAYADLKSFVRDIDGLLGSGSATEAIVNGVKNRLSELIRTRPVLPESVRAPGGGDYARHLLYQDPSGRFEIVIMAWSPGQATPVHDHSGIWCVEGVVDGVIDVTRYDVTEGAHPGTARMEALEVIRAGLGECGALIPPVEFHRIANPYPSPALTLHVYGGRMRSCRVFTERPDGGFDVATRELGFASPEAALSSC
ncbi:MAG TPA: cysteine dioxygenase family protein [Candidatus Polarisedimenticolia bacterium]|nr:cysteine dioxygenase family protein [Candidatus Polarisedimenticolia bacterium]